MTPDLTAEFINEYQAEWNRLQCERRLVASQRDRKLADVNRRIAGMIDAIERGIITPATKERLEKLEAEKDLLQETPVDTAMPTIHPNLAQLYRDKVARLEHELRNPELAAEAKSLLRAMIKTIIVTPGPQRGEVNLELQGSLLRFSQLVPKKTRHRRTRKNHEFKSRWLRGLDLFKHVLQENSEELCRRLVTRTL